ncbi:hypothetical protein HZS_2439 [Henneguya salminicola]|nr:hypothetical protein HZS_2439 [Henneguya salminicola]
MLSMRNDSCLAHIHTSVATNQINKFMNKHICCRDLAAVDVKRIKNFIMKPPTETQEVHTK